MATDRKLHRKTQRLNGIARKAQDAKNAQERKDLETLQKVLDHSQALAKKNPKLFASVMDCVTQLAEASGESVDSIMTDGILVMSDDGHQIRKSPHEILKDVLGIAPQEPIEDQFVIVDGSGVPVRGRAPKLAARIASLRATMPQEKKDVFTEGEPSIERQREAHAAVRNGMNKLDLATCSDVALQEAMMFNNPAAKAEWARRHPEDVG